MLKCIFLKIVPEGGLVDQKSGSYRSICELFAWSCVTWIADFNVGIMSDDDTVWLGTVDYWGWVELDDADRFEIGSKLQERVLLSKTVLTQ